MNGFLGLRMMNPGYVPGAKVLIGIDPVRINQLENCEAKKQTNNKSCAISGLNNGDDAEHFLIRLLS